MARSIAEILRDIRVLEGKQKDAQLEFTKANQKLQAAQVQLSKRVDSGESTEDRIQDLVIRARRVLDGVLVSKYRALEKRLEGKKDEFVVIVYDTEVPFIRGGPEKSRDREATFFRMGVLESELLVLHHEEGFASKIPMITLPVPCYIGWDVTHFFGLDLEEGEKLQLEVVKKNIFAWEFIGTSLQLHDYLDEPMSSNLFIGDEEVKKWLKDKRMETLFNPAAGALRKLVLLPTD